MPVSPSFLKKNDTVLLIASARKVSREEMAPAVQMLKDWGLQVEEGKNLYNSFHQFAGTDEERRSDLQWALDHPDAKAIFFARGGYGTMRIIDGLRFGKFKRHPKWLVGYSDITVLHNHVYNLGFCSLHGTMPINFTKNEQAAASLRSLLSGESYQYEVAAHELNVKGVAEGELVGGNLSLLYAGAGSASDLSMANNILFIEDLDEYLYHIDRMMMQLKRAGKLERLAGLVVGGMTDMRDNAVPFGKTAEEIIREIVSIYNFPVCFNFPAGHIEKNLAFIHGKRARLDVKTTGATLIYT